MEKVRPLHFLLLVSLLAPTVQVRGHSKITIVDAMVDGEQTMLRGELRDRDLHTALPGRAIRTEVQGGDVWRQTARTGAGGVFLVRFPPREGARVRLSFAGDELYLASFLGPVPVDAQLPPVTIDLQGPSQIRLADATVDLSVAAYASGSPIAIDVVLRRDDGRVLGRVRTGPEATRVAIPTDELGPPGPVRISASSERGGHAVLEAMLRAAVHVTMRARPEAAVIGDRIAVEGIVRDSSGPIARAPVTIRARGQRIAFSSTDADGRFSTTFDSDALGEGAIDLEAVHSPRVPWREAGHSAPATIRLAPPRPLPPTAVLVPVALLVVGLVLRGARARLRERRRRAPATPAPGVRPAVWSTIRPALLRRPERSVHGVVWDPFHLRPVGGARITLCSGSHEVDATTDGRGRFAVPMLRDGRHEVSVAARGHVRLAFAIDIPHRGELSGVRVDLEPVRARALRMWCERARPYSDPGRVLLVTPAEMASTQQTLARAARAFESIFYSGQLSEESALDALR